MSASASAVGVPSITWARMVADFAGLQFLAAPTQVGSHAAHPRTVGAGVRGAIRRNVITSEIFWFTATKMEEFPVELLSQTKNFSVTATTIAAV
jgi:hypothetical protein